MPIAPEIGDPEIGVRALYEIFLGVFFGLPRLAWPMLRPTIASTCSLKRSLPKGVPVCHASRIRVSWPPFT